MSTYDPLLALPIELVTSKILIPYLTVDDLVRCSLVSKQWAAVVGTDPVWRGVGTRTCLFLLLFLGVSWRTCRFSALLKQCIVANVAALIRCYLLPITTQVDVSGMHGM